MGEFGPEWRKKMTHVAKVLDTDRDGEITRKDYERFADNCVKVCKVEGAQAKQIRGKILKLWDDFFGAEENEGQRITLQNYPDVVQKRGLEKLRYAIQLCGGLVFDVIDLNGDGVIQEKEFECFHKALNIDDNVTAECFKALDTDGDGLLSYDEFTRAYIDYWTQNEGGKGRQLS